MNNILHFTHLHLEYLTGAVTHDYTSNISQGQSHMICYTSNISQGQSHMICSMNSPLCPGNHVQGMITTSTISGSYGHETLYVLAGVSVSERTHSRPTLNAMEPMMPSSYLFNNPLLTQSSLYASCVRM